MITYADLVDQIASLHISPSAMPLAPLALPNEWFPSVVDSTSSTKGAARVLVAMGANFAKGGGSGPSPTTGAHRKTPPWVEYKLGSQRSNAFKHIDKCTKGMAKPDWNGLRPCNPIMPPFPAPFLSVSPNDFHFVMTNLSPWITAEDWSKIRDQRLEAIFSILAQPDVVGGMLEYFKALQKIVGADAIWMGHGNSEIYGIFLHYCRSLGIVPWFFNSNLSYLSQF